ncbi:DUF2786 domain-containing protein [Pseudomonas lactis]|uniref:DUF2786 domain-containing protein n=1 Tax=Pseudomonas lactis TaxID=1615674 RepID=UPI001F3D93CC|nr:DUF2786 domain-containing protein [Pseudomonas lactis]
MRAPKTHGDNAKVEAKLRKLLALARRGEGGEKDNAQRMLEKLLARHGLSMDDLVDDRREIRWFPISTKYDRKLAAQIMSKVCDSDSPGLYVSKGRVKTIGVEVSPSEAIEFELHYDTLRKALAAHFDDAFSAFVQANQLFPSTPAEDQLPVLNDRDMRVMGMASVISPTPVNPRLERQEAV